jgi:hypothetical protein
VEAVGEEGDEDMRLDARLVLVKDRPDGEVAPRLRGGRLLRFRNASSTLTSWRYKRHSRAGSSSVRLVRSRYRPSRRPGLAQLGAIKAVAERGAIRGDGESQSPHAQLIITACGHILRRRLLHGDQDARPLIQI